jgi:hypothetical protein
LILIEQQLEQKSQLLGYFLNFLNLPLNFDFDAAFAAVVVVVVAADAVVDYL